MIPKIIPSCLLAAATAMPAFWSAAPVMAQDTEIRDPDQITRIDRRLAVIFAQYANNILVSPLLNVGGMMVSLDLLQASAQLDPTQPETWRKLIDLAVAMDREELIEPATRSLLEGVPGDQTAQLARLNAAIDGFNTVDQRAAALEQLLNSTNRQELGPEISARLAFRLADLRRREGNLEEFGHWLGESIMLDPTYSDAVGIATGFLKERVRDRVAYVELLVGLFAADLTDDVILETLNAFLLDSGAYESAERMIRMRIKQQLARGQSVSSGTIARLALSEWGARRQAAALDTISERKQELSRIYEEMSSINDPSQSPLELAQLRAPLPPTLAAIQAVLISERTDFTRNEAIEDLQLSTNFAQDLSNLSLESEAREGRRLLHTYWLLLWLDADQDVLEEKLSEIQKLSPLSDSALQRIEAWKMFRSGQLEEAEKIFRADKDRHLLARVGLAEVLLAAGRERDAAQTLLNIWKSAPGQIVGLWARDQLENLLGTEVPSSAEAMQMNEIVAGLPKIFDRVPEDPRLALTMKLKPRQDIYRPYEPILIDIEVTNHTPIPLGIDGDGPIRNLLLLEADVDVPYETMRAPWGIVVELGSQFRLEPFGKLVKTVDLRRYWVGTLINSHPLFGATIDLNAILNFRTSMGKVSGQAVSQPGLMGLQKDANNIRVDGQRITVGWATKVIEALRKETFSVDDMTNFALMTHVIGANKGTLVSDPIPDEMITRAIDLLVAAFPRMNVNEKAWFIATMDRSPRLSKIWDMAAESQRRSIRLIQLMRIIDDATEAQDIESVLTNSEMISAMNSPDRAVRGLSEWIEQIAEVSRQRRLNELTDQDQETNE